MITGEIEYDLARDSRLNDNKCGHFGSEYNEKIQSWYIYFIIVVLMGILN